MVGSGIVCLTLHNGERLFEEGVVPWSHFIDFEDCVLKRGYIHGKIRV